MFKVNDKSLFDDWTNVMPDLKPEEITYTQETAFPLFLAAVKLDHQEIDFNGQLHILSFMHKPTRVNYWHFEILVCDRSGERIPRDKSSAHTKYLAKSILEFIVAEAICQRKDIVKYKTSRFKPPPAPPEPDPAR